MYIRDQLNKRNMPVQPPSTLPTFKTDLHNRHLIYNYQTHNEQGDPEQWRYEMWFYNADRIIYVIHGGPMAGRRNFQTATYQCIRPGELWQCNWLEETGTICSMVYDIVQGRVSTMIGFSRGHWEMRGNAKGDKRDKGDLERWRSLAMVGAQTDRVMLSEQAVVIEDFRGPGNLEPIDMLWDTL